MYGVVGLPLRELYRVCRTAGCTFPRGVRTARCWCPAPGLVPAVPVWDLLLGRSLELQHRLNTTQNEVSACVLHVMIMLNPKTQGCSGSLLVKLLYILFSMTHSPSMQPVGGCWVILGWKRYNLWVLPDRVQLMDEPLLCLWAVLFMLIPRFPTWLLQELTVRAGSAGIAGNAASKHPLEPVKDEGTVCVIDFWTLLSFRIFAFWQMQNKSKPVQEHRNGTFRLMKLYCVWQMGG